MGEFDIKSTTLDKGLDIIKDLLGKLVSPTIEQTGELIADKIRFVRWKQQVQILEKAKQYIEERNISVKSIPIKILVPLLENASLEENEEMQDKWAKMITNMADSETNLQNQIFPYLLSQISLIEYNGLKTLMEDEETYYPLLVKFRELKKDDYWIKNKETIDVQRKIKQIEQDGFNIPLEEDYEYTNLLRLGLVRQLPPRILIDEFTTGSSHSEEPDERWHQIDAEYETDSSGYRVTELGISFIDICELHGK